MQYVLGCVTLLMDNKTFREGSHPMWLKTLQKNEKHIPPFLIYFFGFFHYLSARTFVNEQTFFSSSHFSKNKNLIFVQWYCTMHIFCLRILLDFYPDKVHFLYKNTWEIHFILKACKNKSDLKLSQSCPIVYKSRSCKLFLPIFSKILWFWLLKAENFQACW